MMKILAAWLMFCLVSLFFLNESARHRRRVCCLRHIRSLYAAEANAVAGEINELMFNDLQDRTGGQNG